MLAPLRADYDREDLLKPRDGSGIDTRLKFVRLIGKGANNSASLFRAPDDQCVVVRSPRHSSDTKRKLHAQCEFEHTKLAAELGVAPVLYDAWYARHRTARQASGLHLVCEYFPHDLHSLLVDETADVPARADELQRITLRHLRTMARAGMLCYDLKPSNMVVKENDVRFIDFGRDFTEVRPYGTACSEKAPVLSYIQDLVERAGSRSRRAQLYSELIYATMVVLLSANIEKVLRKTDATLRCAVDQRATVNFMAHAATSWCRQAPPLHVSMLKNIIRHEDIRATLRHYMGRRNCGTKRTLAYAGVVASAVVDLAV